MSKEKQELERGKKEKEPRDQNEIDCCRDLYQELLSEDELDEEFWIKVHQMQSEGLSWTRAMDEVHVERLIQKYKDSGEFESKDPALVMLKLWPASIQYKNDSEKLPGLE
ncbi:hypothetical protein AWC38_SpisGene13536 [Stylophora pistillata]|uniref:Uncharacterized protein n=1 Tax=Stylophora pistillata TaxID=50429 RepID=A0A2B4S050_STYPI|nr:hypothetical protein AWC38_SpisGene13536 [Stylophora pistillata]